METNKTTEVVFSGKGLVEIPPNLPRDTEVLWMNDNAITKITNIDHLYRLRQLHLDRNRIYSIGDSLSKHRDLETLSLSQNLLRDLDDIAESLSRFKNLKLLVVSEEERHNALVIATRQKQEALKAQIAAQQQQSKKQLSNNPSSDALTLQYSVAQITVPIQQATTTQAYKIEVQPKKHPYRKHLAFGTRLPEDLQPASYKLAHLPGQFKRSQSSSFAQRTGTYGTEMQESEREKEIKKEKKRLKEEKEEELRKEKGIKKKNDQSKSYYPLESNCTKLLSKDVAKIKSQRTFNEKMEVEKKRREELEQLRKQQPDFSKVPLPRALIPTIAPPTILFDDDAPIKPKPIPPKRKDYFTFRRLDDGQVYQAHNRNRIFASPDKQFWSRSVISSSSRSLGRAPSLGKARSLDAQQFIQVSQGKTTDLTQLLIESRSI
ncbi:MAG: hypothetical protein EZS28_007462 [Streblomastix strix]|uniref:Leucine Rich Repeat family protein n=1 Tax=Streblomastix strix TaxID=222440 RepID=A0A5J4WPX3_9EUKA|nr:MAG: hypothetical protein EZS28_007462 [Streblomastix strix]